MKNDNSLIGVINIYKEKGFTSHDVVNIVRKSLNRVKTGHTGTLDPDAEGVLPICIGKATKLADYIASDIKEYKAEITFGLKTTTEDISGDIIEKKDVCVSDDEIRKAILSFLGDNYQTPPMYSAIKVNGKKLYELAREGKEIERKSRKIFIYEIRDIKRLAFDKYEFKVLCSKGTYIRTLCKDIGEKLGCGACMSDLTRTRSGNFYIEDSIKIDEFKKLVANGELDKIIMPVERVLEKYKKVYISSLAEKFVENGNKISLNFLNDEKLIENEVVLAIDWNNKIIGLYQVLGECIKPLTRLI